MKEGFALFRLFIWGFFWGAISFYFSEKDVFSFPLFFPENFATFQQCRSTIPYTFLQFINRKRKRDSIANSMPPTEQNKTDTCTIAIAMMADVHGLPLPDETPEADYVRTDTTSFWDVYALARRILGGCVSTAEEVGWGIVGMFPSPSLLLYSILVGKRMAGGDCIWSQEEGGM